MHQKIKIVSALVSALTLAACALAAPVALAGSPLLSGYGGPGAGEQAILGSTLLGGAGGDSGSGGSSGGSTGGGQGGGGAASSTGTTGGSPATGPGTARAGTSKSQAGETPTRRGHKRLGGGAGRTGRTHVSRAGASAYVYPTTLHAASYNSPALGISGGDLLALVGTIATLVLLGVLTIRLVRLQP
jgi:hypothetical protein